jgi:hypothetical protein
LSQIRRQFLDLIQRNDWASRLISLYRLGRAGGYIDQTGWLISERSRSPIDKAGNPIPWMNYPLIAFLTDRISKDLNVFEWGCGSSTLWFGQKAGSVVSCEHDRKWYEAMGPRVGTNVDLIYKDHRHDDYINLPKTLQSKFDIIVVDGKKRIECADTAIQCLSEAGAILWDNTERAEYWPKIGEISNSGFRNLSFEGLIPGFPDLCRTTILYRSNNCLGI